MIAFDHMQLYLCVHIRIFNLFTIPRNRVHIQHALACLKGGIFPMSFHLFSILFALISIE